MAADYPIAGTAVVAIGGRSSRAELARLERSWSTIIPTGSAFTNVAAMPTTRAELLLHNGEATGGRSYLIDSISWMSLTSTAAATGVTVIYQVNTSAVTDDSAVLINSPTGATYAGSATRDLALTTMTANKWTIAGAVTGGAAASIGTGLVANIDGAIVLPPGYTLGVNAVVGTAVGTSIMGIAWSEVQL